MSDRAILALGILSGPALVVLALPGAVRVLGWIVALVAQ